MYRPIKLKTLRNNQYFTLIEKPFSPMMRMFKLMGCDCVRCKGADGYHDLPENLLVMRYNP